MLEQVACYPLTYLYLLFSGNFVIWIHLSMQLEEESWLGDFCVVYFPVGGYKGVLKNWVSHLLGFLSLRVFCFFASLETFHFPVFQAWLVFPFAFLYPP